MSSNQISRIYLVCYKNDVHLARICIASIRYWYPDIDIFLIKDEASGTFDTTFLERYWGVQIAINNTPFRHGLFNAMAAFFQDFEGRGLVVDPDIVFAGRVIDILEKESEDFLVNPEYVESSDHPNVFNTYYDYKRIKSHDPSYKYPGYCFNAGQIVFTNGIIKQDDFLKLLNITESSTTAKLSKTFRHGDQGIWNYVLNKKQQAGELTIGKVNFMVWPSNKYEKKYPIDLNIIQQKNNKYPFLIHWAGITGLGFISLMTYSKVLKFFRQYYYSKIPNSRVVMYKDQIIFLSMVLRRIVKPRMIKYHSKRIFSYYFVKSSD